MARTPGTLRRTPLALVTSLFLTAALLGGVAANAASTVRKFSVTMPSCVKPSTTTTLTATITNSGTTTAGQKIGSIFLDSPEANFGNITPASAFIITDPTTGAVRTDWTGKLESAYGSGSDRFDLDGLYLVANNSGATLAPGASIKVTFPVTVKSPTGLKPFYPSAWTGLTPNTGSSFSLISSVKINVTSSCVGTATKLAFGTQPSGAKAGATIAPAVTVRVLDANNNLVTTDNSTSISLSASGGSGSLTGGGGTTAVGGVATFSGLSINKTGTYTLNAAATGLTGAASNSFTITPGDPAKLAFGTPPSDAAAGATINPAVTVQVLDANDNLVTTDNSTSISLSASGGSGSLTGGGGTTAVGGVATFSGLSINKTGTYTLNAAATGLTGAASTSFTIGSGGAHHLTITAQPSDAAAGAPTIGLTVEIRDSNDNVVNSSDAIKVTLNGGPGILSGTAQVNASGGTATFSGLSVNKVGTYSLTASDVTTPAVTSVDSGDFTISTGQAALVEFTQQPTDTQLTDNINGSTGVQVHVTDTNGNDVTLTNVTLTLGVDPTGTATINGGSDVTAQTDGVGVATFYVTVAPTSSGYKFEAKSGNISTLSDAFAMTSSAANGCSGSDCTQSLDSTSTVTAPQGTIIIVETNQLDCGSVLPPGTDIAGTVTIIPPDTAPPAGHAGFPVAFDDEVNLPVYGLFPFCKDPNPTQAVPLCSTIGNGLDQPAGTKACLEQGLTFFGTYPQFTTAALHSVLWLDANDPPIHH